MVSTEKPSFLQEPRSFCSSIEHNHAVYIMFYINICNTYTYLYIYIDIHIYIYNFWISIYIYICYICEQEIEIYSY